MLNKLTNKDPQLFKLLGHPIRLQTSKLLLSSPMNVGELYSKLQKSQSTVSQHLQILRKNRLVIFRKEGKSRVYQLNPKYKKLIGYLLA